MFKRRSGLGGLRIFVGPMRREDPATGAGAGGAGAGAGGGGGAPAPVVPPTADPAPVTPPAVDVTQTPEYKKAVADAEAKARLGTAEKARAGVLDELAQHLGLKPKDVDPAKIGQELADARTENASLKAELEIGKAARSLGADEDMVTAVLAHKRALADLDPSAADYSAKVAAAVKAAVDANPRLKNEPAIPVRTPGTSGPAAGGMGKGAGETVRPSMHDAITAAMTPR